MNSFNQTNCLHGSYVERNFFPTETGLDSNYFVLNNGFHRNMASHLQTFVLIKKCTYSILPYLGAKDGFSFLQKFAESCSSSRRQLAVDNSLRIHICDTHILAGCLYLQATERQLNYNGWRKRCDNGCDTTNIQMFKPHQKKITPFKKKTYVDK